MTSAASAAAASSSIALTTWAASHGTGEREGAPTSICTDDLQAGFRIGDWLVEPRERRISGRGHVHTLSPAQIRILLCLAEHPGTPIERRQLRESAWSDRTGTDDMLRTELRALRAYLGDRAGSPRHLLGIRHDGVVLLARVSPVVSGAPADPADPTPSLPDRPNLARRAAALLRELRKRGVLKVLGAYLVGMWLVLQVAQTTFAPLHFPAWWMTALTILAVTGIPIVATLAWAFELEGGRLVLDGSTGAVNGESFVHLPRARRAIAPWIVLGVTVMAAVTGVAWWQSIHDRQSSKVTTTSLAPALSLAVLPLTDLSSAKGTDYLGDGLSEEISSQLANIPGMRVAARTSTIEFKGKNTDVRSIGEALGVRHVLEGSVRRDDTRLRISVQLVDASTGYRVWHEDYDRDWRDVLSIQEEIARHVAGALEVVLTPESEKRLRRGQPLPSLDAYDRYLAGLSALRHAGDIGQLRKTIALFDAAIRLDSTLPQARAGRCRAGLALYVRTRSTPDFTEAEAACYDALELDADLKENEIALAELYLASGRHEQAEAVYRGLVRQHPLDADILRGLADALTEQGELAEAERFLGAAVAAEPNYWRAYNALGTFQLSQGRFADAAEAFSRAVQRAPANATAVSNLGSALFMQVRLEEAARTFEAAFALAPSPTAHGNLGSAYYYLGRFADAAAQFEKAMTLAPSHYGFAAGLAESLWAMPERRGESVRAYRQAIALVEESLKVDPTNAASWAYLAHYRGRVGDTRGAGQAQFRAESLGRDDYYAQLYLALLEADRGSTDAAVAALTRALQLGYPRGLLEADPTLRQLVNLVPPQSPESRNEIGESGRPQPVSWQDHHRD